MNAEVAAFVQLREQPGTMEWATARISIMGFRGRTWRKTQVNRVLVAAGFPPVCDREWAVWSGAGERLEKRRNLRRGRGVQ